MKELTVYRVRGKVQYLFPHRGTGDTQLAVTRRGQTTGWDFVGVQVVVKVNSSFEISGTGTGGVYGNSFLF